MAELSSRLAKLEKSFPVETGKAPDDIGSLSEVLRLAQSRDDFPREQTPRWLWVASRYRIAAPEGSPEAAKAAAALQLLSETVAGAAIDESDIQDLNWVLDATVRTLASHVGPAGLRGCLSAAELEEIDGYLHGHDDTAAFDVDALRGEVEGQLELLRRFGGVGDLTSFDTKVEALFRAASRPGRETAAARAALRYLADENDVVGDRQGVIGLVDDIYVVEWAYAAVESQTRFLPLLEAMLVRWPFIGTTGLGSCGASLDRYGQYVACAALFTIFGPGSGTLILRETGAFPTLCAVAAGLECTRIQSLKFDEEMALWPANSPVTVSDGTATFHATFNGRMDVGGKPRFRLGVRDRGTITMGEEVLPLISLSHKKYRRLSSGQEIATWLKDRNIDPLTNIAGNGRRRPRRHEAVLLVGPRHRLDEYLPYVRPLGTPAAALLGVRWIDAQGRHHDLPGSASDCPLVYACADASAACELVSDPPDHVDAWRIIVDGARLGQALHAALSTAAKLDRVNICVLAELAEREATQELTSQGLRALWYLEDQDVEVPPLRVRARRNDDALARFLRRQGNHWAAVQRTHVQRDELLERLAAYLAERDGRVDSVTSLLDAAVSAFLRKASGQPLGSPAGDDDMRRAAKLIAFQAAALAPYDDGAARLREFMAGLPTGGPAAAGRRDAISRIVRSAPLNATIAIVCRSEAIAQRCRSETADDASFGRARWLAVDELRQTAPYDTVVVPGWLDRLRMRELSANGYGGRTELVLLPFEQTWFERTNDALRRWERRLEDATVDYLNDRVEAFGVVPARWRHETARRLEKAIASPSEEIAPEDVEIERVEARALDRMLATTFGRSDNPLVKAQLVLLEEPGSFALLPPLGQVIVLDAPNRPRSNANGTAERQLMLSVAQLEAGMLLALPETSDRDLLDARADAVMKEAAATRTLAGSWKTALRDHFGRTGESQHAFAQRLRAAGEPRDAATVRAWATDSRSIAPRNHRRVIPLIGRLTGDQELEVRAAEVSAAADRIYVARGKAAELLLQEIFSGELDLGAERLILQTASGQLSYALHRVDRCLGIRDVPSELVGRAARLSMLPDGLASVT
ncbi:hypothetical protein [uncultured Sphingomonas sp.]|uniref:hypothetical protein n=1 Tax=uncultured Sphingomonas sp. TaxID=158754 RepID=UPI0035CB3BA6